jgi:hypothetical protein
VKVNGTAVNQYIHGALILRVSLSVYRFAFPKNAFITGFADRQEDE